MHIHGIQYYIKFDVTVVDLEGGGGGWFQIETPLPLSSKHFAKKKLK